MELDAHLAREDVRERRLAEPGRAAEQDVIERLAASARGLDEDPEVLLVLVLPDVLVERASGERGDRSASRPAVSLAARTRCSSGAGLAERGGDFFMERDGLPAQYGNPCSGTTAIVVLEASKSPPCGAPVKTTAAVLE